MSHAPLILGINRTQDASVCLLRGSRLEWAIQKERLTRQKHHWGRTGDIPDIYLPRLPELDQPIDVLVECYSSDAELDNLPIYERELATALTLAPGCKRIDISHHLAHVYSVFHPSPFERAAVMIVDGQGNPVSALTEHWRGAAWVPGNWCEVSSFYRADRERVICIDKQVWNRDEERLVGLGMFYFLLTQAIFPAWDCPLRQRSAARPPAFICSPHARWTRAGRSGRSARRTPPPAAFTQRQWACFREAEPCSPAIRKRPYHDAEPAARPKLA